MARRRRRLILVLLGVLAGLALAAAGAVWWFVDPERLRARLETEATTALGRTVRLYEPLRWRPGWRIAIAGGAGEIGNAAGFGAAPLARWSGVELGLALRPLLRRQVEVDRIVIEGLALDLQRDAQGRDNWQLPGLESGGGGAATSALRIEEIVLRNAEVRYRDAGSGADWHVRQMHLHARLPPDLGAAELGFGDVELSAQLAGGPLAPQGVPLQFAAPRLQIALPAVSLPEFSLRWADARMDGSLAGRLDDRPAVSGRIAATAPSLRALLATAGATPPPTSDPAALGAFSVQTDLRYADGAAALTALSLQLDDTHLTGTVSMPSLTPPSFRFDLAADRMMLDRYLPPDDPDADPFELPLAELRALDARGVLRIDAATVAGADAKLVRIDVE